MAALSGPKNHVLEKDQVHPLEGTIFGNGRPIEKHLESVKSLYATQKSTTVTAGLRQPHAML